MSSNAMDLPLNSTVSGNLIVTDSYLTNSLILYLPVTALCVLAVVAVVVILLLMYIKTLKRRLQLLEEEMKTKNLKHNSSKNVRWQ